MEEIYDVSMIKQESSLIEIPTPLHQCPKCTRTFKNLGHFKCHFYQVHSEFRLTDYIDSPCLPEKKRIRRKHTAESLPFKCSDCDKDFKNQFALTVHGSKTHSKHSCQFCDKHFSVASSLASHLKLHKSDENSKSEKIKAHKRPTSSKKGKDAKLYSCEECKTSFTLKSALNTHNKTHHCEESLVCHICNADFKSSELLKKHLESHARKAPRACPKCGKEFARKWLLDRHALEHTES